MAIALEKSPMAIQENIDIAGALARLWEAAAAQNKIKACLFNLIIYTATEGRSQYVHDLIEKIIEKFPCRVFHIAASPAAPEESLSVEVNAETRQEGNLSMICDQIHIHAGGSALKRVPSLLLPHLVPDLPTFLLWGEDPTKEQMILPAIQRFATRLIFDSEAVDDPTALGGTILQEMERFPMDFVDLNWARIACWRHVLAQVFDTREKVDLLFQTSAFQVAYSSKQQGDSQPNQALYLQCWLAARLGWEFSSSAREADRLVTRYRSHQREIFCDLHPAPEDRVSAGTLLSVQLESQDFSIAVDRIQDTPHARVRYETREKCDLPFLIPLPSLFKGRGFMKEVFYQPTSQHYQWMLENLQKIPLEKK